jgi:hypothetical protein
VHGDPFPFKTNKTFLNYHKNDGPFDLEHDFISTLLPSGKKRFISGRERERRGTPWLSLKQLF